MRRKGENPQQFMLLNSSLRRASGTGASVQKRMTPVEGITIAAESLLGGFRRT